ncbi:hypothetical protein GCM10027048_29960 [Hymenobacter coalescens]
MAVAPLLSQLYRTGTSQFAAWLGPALALLVVGLVLSIRLDVRLDENGVRYRMSPLHLNWHHRSWADIRYAYLREYRPLAEYGGWGMRGIFRRNRALTVAGSQGLQLEFTNGTKLLLGTQLPARVEQALVELDRLAPAG